MKLITTITALVCATLAASCSSDDEPSNIEPQLITGEATNITRTEATLTGQVVLRGNADVSDLYFRYGETEAMSQQTGQLSAVDGQVSCTLRNLISNTRYYYRLQGGNGRTTVQGESHIFTTEPGDKPTVGAIEVLSQGSVSLIVGYDITDNGGEDITETGVYVVEVGSDTSRKILAETQTADNAQCKVRITDLKQNTQYELKAFAVNRNGESLGATTKHTTSSAIVVSVAGSLSGVMTEAERQSTTLRITGQMNSSDIAYLRDVLSEPVTATAQNGNTRSVNLTDVSIVKGDVTYDGQHYTEPNTISMGMFSDCRGIGSLILPDDATTVSRNSMENCAALTSLTVPTNATTVEPSSGCTALKEILVSPMNANFKSVGGVLYDAKGETLIWYPLGLDDDYAFPSTLQSIGSYAFQGYGATNITIPDGVTSIGRASFCNSSVKTLTLPTKLTTILSSTFQNCQQLKTVYIGAQTTLINDYAFYNCPLESIHLSSTIPPVCSEQAFKSPSADVFSTCTLYVPTGSKSTYRNHSVWGQFKKIVEE